MQTTCDICNNHYKSLSAYKTHLVRNKKCMLMRDGNSILNCQYCNELKSSRHFLEIHISKCPKRIERLIEENDKLLEEIKLLKEKTLKENDKLLEEIKLLKEKIQSKSKPYIYAHLFPITTETLTKCYKHMFEQFKNEQVKGQIIQIKRIHRKYLSSYLLSPLKILVCDTSRNKYEIIHNNQIIIDWDLCITKGLIKQFIQDSELSVELYDILISTQPKNTEFVVYEGQKIAYKDFADFIASDFSTGVYIDQVFKSNQFKGHLTMKKQILNRI